MEYLKPAIDLNADLGEGFPWDAELLKRVTSANVCCGAHAGDPDSIRATLRMARERGVVVGAHPGYPDRENFGRVARAIAPAEARELVLGQVEDLRGLASPMGVPIRYVKPHGALYNQAQDDTEIAGGIVEAARALGLPVVGMPGGEVEAAASSAGLRFVAEGFVDRSYGANGRLKPRTEDGASITEPNRIVMQLSLMVGTVTPPPGMLTGIPFELFHRIDHMPFDEYWERLCTICIHGDREEAVDIADLVRSALRLSKVELRAFAG